MTDLATTSTVSAEIGGTAGPELRRRRLPSWGVVTWASVIWLTIVVFCAVFADLLPIRGYETVDFQNPQQRPFRSWSEPLGTDFQGRSILSRSIHGARVSLAVGVVSVGVGMFLGGLLGLLAGYYRGWLDRLVTIVTDAFLAFPPLVLLLAIVAIRGRSITNLVLALAVLNTPTLARVTRANALVFVQREFVTAARAMGARHRRIIAREILPNVVMPVLSYGFIIAAVLIIAEGALSFLGLGIPPPRPSWGGMIAQGNNDLRSHPHNVFVPSAIMFMTVFALNQVGDHFRRSSDVRESAL